MKMIECKCGCGTLLEEKDKWGRKRSYISGHNNRKYDDPTQYKREWNHRNRETRYEYKIRWLHNFKDDLLKSKKNECNHCGLKYDGTNQCVFDFHHLDPSKKKFSVSKNTMNHKSKRAIINEAKKCIVLCSNCHRLEHWGEKKIETNI